MNLDLLSPEEPKPLSAALGALSKGELGLFKSRGTQAPIALGTLSKGELGLFKFGGTQAPIENLSIDVYIDMQ